MTLSDQAPTYFTGLPLGRKQGLPMQAPFPADATSLHHYLGAIRLVDTGGGNFAVHDFYKSGSYVVFSTPRNPVIPGSNSVPLIVDNPAVPNGTYAATINPSIFGIPVVPPHTRMVRTKWTIIAGADQVAFTLMNQAGYTVFDHLVDVNLSETFTVDLPMPPDGSLQYSYRIFSLGTALVRGSVLGFYEDIP